MIKFNQHHHFIENRHLIMIGRKIDDILVILRKNNTFLIMEYLLNPLLWKVELKEGLQLQWLDEMLLI